VIADSVSGNDLVIANNGNMYITSPDGATRPGKLYLIRPNGEKVVVDEGLKFPNGVTLSPDQTQLYATNLPRIGSGSIKYKKTERLVINNDMAGCIHPIQKTTHGPMV
jgi:sugar lactone lactonase YvrE